MSFKKFFEKYYLFYNATSSNFVKCLLRCRGGDKEQEKIPHRHRVPELPQEGHGGGHVHEGRHGGELGHVREGSGLLLQEDHPVRVGVPPRSLLRGALEQEGKAGENLRNHVRKVQRSRLFSGEERGARGIRERAVDRAGGRLRGHTHLRHTRTRRLCATGDTPVYQLSADIIYSKK